MKSCLCLQGKGLTDSFGSVAFLGFGLGVGWDFFLFGLFMKGKHSFLIVMVKFQE